MCGPKDSVAHLQAKNIRSGWKNIFFVFSLAANDNGAPYGVCFVATGGRLEYRVDRVSATQCASPFRALVAYLPTTLSCSTRMHLWMASTVLSNLRATAPTLAWPWRYVCCLRVKLPVEPPSHARIHPVGGGFVATVCGRCGARGHGDGRRRSAMGTGVVPAIVWSASGHDTVPARRSHTVSIHVHIFLCKDMYVSVMVPIYFVVSELR